MSSYFAVRTIVVRSTPGTYLISTILLAELPIATGLPSNLQTMTPTAMQLDRARYIRTILARHDHNQTDLGRLLGITQQAAGRKLKGIRKFEVDELVVIAEAYRVDVGYLLRPPNLDEVLGPVPAQAQGLLTSTKYQVVLVDALGVAA